MHWRTNSRGAVKVKSGVKAGGWSNHSKTAVKVKSGVKAGSLTSNHSKAAVKVKTGLKAGGKWVPNHNRTALTTR